MRESDAQRYQRTAMHAAALVVARYSTSFGLACRLLAPALRPEIRALYALVRIADETVDGAAEQAGMSTAQQANALDALEDTVYEAIRDGHSTNPIVHAFASVARRRGIDAELIAPFFASMRRDLDPAPFTAAEMPAYIHGSAEVVGLMCLACFVEDPVDRARLREGARALGSAFQKVNFLRDLGDDVHLRGRNYFPDAVVVVEDRQPVRPDADESPAAQTTLPATDAAARPHRSIRLTETDRDRILDDIDAELAQSGEAIEDLPAGSRLAVATAHALFSELSRRLRQTPVEMLVTSRTRVPGWRKAQIVARCMLHERVARRRGREADRSKAPMPLDGSRR
ncbi:phytoene/squalene synthase family protein [Pseudoclavibacter sp. CFCC 14310]|uniref:phytoene/squalene synthase family protein n=1 Tax=Pseudoclavibacter sp. CFCC 14310 TaxID=2615180 RepID=UPI0013017453|nr:squalene/phytoene synthase family protein [Pseudoclavibacter sp. CFCC 14310]KAB1643761.1 phytoene/squalene synthase family protein [Pseudoclavibacter sp. CFCC 14310]